MPLRPVLAALLALLPLALEAATAGELAFGSGPRLPLALLPWLALAGVPCDPRRVAPPRADLWLALALPVLGLAAGLDAARGDAAPRGAYVLGAAAGLLLVLLLASAAARGGSAAALLWLALVVLVPALAAAFHLAAASGAAPPPAWLDALALRSPLGWAWSWARPDAAPPSPAGALVVAALVRLAAARPRGARARGPEAGAETRGSERRLAAVLALPLLVPQADGGNRLWVADVALRGPLTEVTLDAGADGATVLGGELLPGEEVRLRVPVPVRAPLGPASLALVPAPRVVVGGGAEEGGGATFLGWSEEQPAEGWARVPAGLRARPRPPAPAARAHARPGAVAAAAAFVALVLALRRRRVLVHVAAAVGLAAGVALGARGARPPEPLVVVEGQAGAPTWLAVHAAPEGLALDLEAGVRLEARPDGPLTIRGSTRGGPWRASFAAGGAGAPGVRGGLLTLHALAPPRPDLAALAPAEALEEAWTRTPRGEWRFHGPVPGAGAAAGGLPPGRPGPDPPGWLAAALPPGTGVLLARAADGAWLRVSGVELPPAPGD